MKTTKGYIVVLLFWGASYLYADSPTAITTPLSQPPSVSEANQTLESPQSTPTGTTLPQTTPTGTTPTITTQSVTNKLPFQTAIHLDNRQRVWFKQAIEHLRHGRVDAFRKIQSELNDYVLAPYLEQAYLLDRITFKNRKAIQTFLDTYDNEPVAIPVRYRFLKLLAKKNQTNLFLTYYRSSSDVSLQCAHLRFRLKTDESKDEIFAQAERLWLYGRSRPDACDPVFKAMKNAGYLTQSLIWQRLVLAVESRQSGLVRYLTSLLEPERVSAGTFAQHALRNPNALLTVANQDITPAHTEVAAAIIEKWVWNHPEDALRIYEKASERFAFTYVQKRRMARDFSLALASKDHPRASEWLENIAVDEQDDLLLRWKLAYELRKMDWEAVNQWVEKTPAPKHSQNDWNYWRGRSEFALGNSARGNEVFQNLAKERSYYGFLASAHLGSQPNLKQENYAFTPSVIGDLSQHPRALIAYELWQADRHLSARREWNHLKRSLDHDQKKHLAVVAHQWGWHEQAIFTLAETGLHDAVNMRFPIAFQSLMQQESASSQLDLTLSLAIARKESAFMPDARSRVGAVGLMQIMPQTARYITRKEKLPNMYSRQLTDPLVNIKLGTRYLKRLIDEHEGNAVLATASYNAGKHKVAKWLPKDSTLPADIWIEVVPYKETRSYIKNVLAYQQIYRSLLGKEDNYFNELIHMEIQSLP